MCGNFFASGDAGDGKHKCGYSDGVPGCYYEPGQESNLDRWILSEETNRVQHCRSNLLGCPDSDITYESWSCSEGPYFTPYRYRDNDMRLMADIMLCGDNGTQERVNVWNEAIGQTYCECEFNQSTSCEATNECITMCEERYTIQDMACAESAGGGCQDIIDQVSNSSYPNEGCEAELLNCVQSNDCVYSVDCTNRFLTCLMNSGN